MNRFVYLLCTLIAGFFLQLFLNRYISLYSAAPQLLLLLVIAHGFLYGPVTGELLGFGWGLMTDSLGVNLFGLNALILTLAGYVSGKLRRRVASERASGQLVIALIATVYYWLSVSLLYSIFEEGFGEVPLIKVILEMLLNVIFVSAVFWATEWWIDAWRLEREHI